MQGRFIANASHEPRTPLAVTRTVIQVGLSSSDPTKVRHAKQELLRSNDRSIALINGLLVLVRGEQELRRREQVRLDVMVNRAISESTPVGCGDRCPGRSLRGAGRSCRSRDGFWNPARETVRETVNNWIRTSGAFDGVVDFDAAMRDPQNPD